MHWRISRVSHRMALIESSYEIGAHTFNNIGVFGELTSDLILFSK